VELGEGVERVDAVFAGGGQVGADGTAPPNAHRNGPAMCRNLSSDRSAGSVTMSSVGLRRRVVQSRMKSTTCPADNRGSDRSSEPGSQVKNIRAHRR
jgi:hypothetical protein